MSNAAEQAGQGYEEAWFVVGEPKQIIANTNYFAYMEWEQEADGGFLDNSPLMSKVVSKVEYTDNALNNLYFDVIGQYSKKVTNNK